MRGQVHFYFALFAFMAFVLSGLYMKCGFHLVDKENILQRMMFRANHIYILFASMLNFAIPYFKRSRHNRLEWASSVFILLSTTGLVVSFYIDPYTESLTRDLSRYSIIGLFIGYLLQLFIMQSMNSKDSKSSNLSDGEGF